MAESLYYSPIKDEELRSLVNKNNSKEESGEVTIAALADAIRKWLNPIPGDKSDLTIEETTRLTEIPGFNIFTLQLVASELIGRFVEFVITPTASVGDLLNALNTQGSAQLNDEDVFYKKPTEPGFLFDRYINPSADLQPMGSSSATPPTEGSSIVMPKINESGLDDLKQPSKKDLYPKNEILKKIGYGPDWLEVYAHFLKQQISPRDLTPAQKALLAFYRNFNN